MGRVKQKAAKGGKKLQRNLSRLQQIDEAEDEISSDQEATKNNKKAKKGKTKKAKPKKTKKRLQKTLISESEQRGIESKADEEIQCSEPEDYDTDSKDPKKKKDAWKMEWKEGGWTMDPNEHQPWSKTEFTRF